MTEVHTTEVTEWVFSRRDIVALLHHRGFKAVGGILVGTITCELIEAERVIRVTQTITEEHKEDMLLEAEKEFRKEVEVDRVADYQGKPVGLGSNTEEVEAKIRAGKGLVEKIAGGLAEDNKDVFREAGWEISKEPKIEFQKVWRIEVTGHTSDMATELVARGARHTEGKLDGIVGYDFQEGYVVVVQTVLEG